MRLTRLLLAGTAIPAIAMCHPVIARDIGAPIVIAQQDKDKNKNKDQENRQRKDNRQENRQQRQEQRGERREQKQEQRQQRQGQQQQQQQDRRELKQQQKQQDVQGRERRDQRQDLRQQQQQDRRETQREQKEQRRETQKEQKEQRQEQQQNQQDQRRQQQQTREREKTDEKLRKDQRRESEDRQQRPQPDQRQGGRTGDGERRSGADDGRRKLDDIRGERRERKEGGRTIIQEGNRTIVRDGGRTFIRRDESDRLRRVGRDVNVQRVGGETRTVVIGPNGQRIVTVTDANGRLLRRSRFVNDREVIIIDNRPRGGRRADAFFVSLPALAIASLAIPRDRYIVEAESAPPEYIYGALMAPPVERLPRAYTLDEIRYSPEVRDRMPRIDLDTITFDLGSWEIAPSQYDRLAPIADGIKRAIARNPNEVFLIEGHTDATGTEEDNLSLSDRRAEAVAVILTDEFQIPPENLTTQGYGEQQLKIPSEGPERANRRVTVRRITPLLQQGQAAGGPVPQ
ncbi:MAG: OmpA family protein [Pseudorhodoplanes sp.]|uniref:OmpA family protein n=1 Tax=Pseudorhodoplanes sp. TaxID=1934341 RepID=UPI003D0E7CEC